MIPNITNIQAAKNIYNKVAGWKKIDTLLYDTFKKYPDNNDHDTVVFKSELIDSLYNCSLMMDKTAVGDHIVKLNLDLRNNPVLENIDQIADHKITPKTKRIGWVFSSKYCHFHIPEKYPIYDSFARRSMKILTGKTHRYFEDFSNFTKELDKMIADIPGKISYKNMDIYLYLFGQWKYPKSSSANIKRIIKNNPKQFTALQP